jgi:A/G-specific adenine glycosylase
MKRAKKGAAKRESSAHIRQNKSDMGQQLSELRAALLAWYRQHQRQLPWRQNRDPYRVWVSEIMLQQTRVAAVLEHYRDFLRAFPKIEALAEASEAAVLARWSGLGYYRRARMLHRAAIEVVGERKGEIPHNSEELRRLPGVGRYTAAAIASIAFGEAVAVVDGNVERVLSRLDGCERPGGAAWQRAQELLDAAHAGEWNQAMMELGAMLCTPRAPQCLVCPVRSWCAAPGAVTGKAQEARRKLQVWRALIVRGGKVFLVQRPADAAKMPGMWELPECEGDAGAELCRLRHSITDTDYEVCVASARLRELGAAVRAAGAWVKREELTTHPLTGLTRKILKRLLPA